MDDDAYLTSSASISLDDKWTTERGTVLINGTQALARVLMAQHALDRAAGLNTAGYITGYRGSPLGNVDSTLWSIGDRLREANIHFVPGVNEDLAATAVRGTQQLDSVPLPTVDGVFAAWYGKGPGVDRSGDALKHGNIAGAHKNGGVLICYGDDHGGKSSTVAHHSEQAMAAALIPSLYPANVEEIIQYGLLGFAMSRFSGSWVGLKLVNEVVEQTLTAKINLPGLSPFIPDYGDLPPEGIHSRMGPFAPLRDEVIVSDYRLPLVQRFVRANGIDRTIFRACKPRLGLITAGKSYADTCQALQLLQVDHEEAAALGISLYKVACIWPLEPEGIVEFAQDHETLFVIEEKKSFIELQAASAIINCAARPRLIGKLDEVGAALLPSALQLEPARIAVAIADRLTKLGVEATDLQQRAALLRSLMGAVATEGTDLPRRSPYFCSGCPHNRSTQIPPGSLSMTGIGCHGMANFVRPQVALPPTHMGGEGGNWIGLAPFSGTKHIFQNMGDGTYYHSGLMAIRAAVASGVNITYKILYNDAVAMTGGQPVDGPISVAAIARQVRDEGVDTIVLLSDNPDAHRGNPDLPDKVRVGHRDELNDIQQELREVSGCTVLIYAQTCAAEKRRRRKRGLYPDPPKRLFISKEVCEGCGDCSVQSTCVSIAPVETQFGTKRQIDQSSCNKDYSCANGFCPSFITIEGAPPRKPARATMDAGLLDELPPPDRRMIGHNSCNVMIAGIGGTGVITVAAVIGMAAHIDGLATSMFDMTGLAQKNGAVFSHVRMAASAEDLHSQKLGLGEADLLIAFDLVAGASAEASVTLADDRTRALVNSDVTPTVAFQFNRDSSIDSSFLAKRLEQRVGSDNLSLVDASAIATTLLGDVIGANMFLVGVAVQKGLLPVTVTAIEQAITLNATAKDMNLRALALGRLYVADSARFASLMPRPVERRDPDLVAIIAARTSQLEDYQNAAYAQRYVGLVERVRTAERAISTASEALSLAVAQNYGRLLGYKDEYEVARLLTSPSLYEEIARTFEGKAKLSFNLAPPILGGRPMNGRPPKRQFPAWAMRPILQLLAKARFLRGTAIDPFGYSTERRAERRLIDEYEALVEDILRSLTPATLADAVRLVGLASMIRGYGPVKEAAIIAYGTALREAKDQLGSRQSRGARAA